MSHSYCRLLLRQVRQEAKEAGVKIPEISSAKQHEQNYAVFIGDDWFTEHNSCCAYYARFESVGDYIEAKQIEAGKKC